MRTVAIVQARLGSSRLPGKALLALRGQPMLKHVLERVLSTLGLDEVVLATSVSPRDIGLVHVAGTCGIRSYAGSEHDVLDRVQAAAKKFHADVVMRVTADCPLFAPDIAAAVLALHRQETEAGGSGVYAWNDTARSGWPDGTDVEVFDYHLLELASFGTVSRNDREHVTPGIRKLARLVATHPSPHALSAVKLSVDTAADFDRVSAVAMHLDQDFSWAATYRACVEAGIVPAF